MKLSEVNSEILKSIAEQYESIVQAFTNDPLHVENGYPSISVRLSAEIIIGNREYKSIYDANKYLKSLSSLPDWKDWASSTFPDLMPLLTSEEMLDRLGWFETCDGEVHCKCGEKIEVVAFLGSASSAHCPACKIYAINLTAPQFASQSSITIPDFQDLCRISEGEQKLWVIDYPSKAEVQQ